MELPVNETNCEFIHEKHIYYCKHCVFILPQRCESVDAYRTVTSFFAISSLDHLQALDKIENDIENIVDWIYSMQVTSEVNDETSIVYGFRSSTSCLTDACKNSRFSEKAHLASTYTALCTLVVLGDDLSRVKKQEILSSIKKLQLPDGSFRPMDDNCENDMRFIYCTSCICFILDDWSAIDVDKAVHFIKKSRNYDGGIGQGPGLESHGGSTFCAIASLWLMQRLDTTFSENELKSLKRWLVFRQYQGFHGRPNKPDDTCYSFWVGATLKVLGCYDLIDYNEVCQYVLSTQDQTTGGISKWIDFSPDLMHTYFGLGGLLLKDNGTPQIHPALNISQRAADFLQSLHSKWRQKT